MKLQKKIGAGLLALALVLSLGACSGSADSSTASNAASSTPESIAAESASAAPEAESSAASAPLDGIKSRADKVRNAHFLHRRKHRHERARAGLLQAVLHR